MNNETSRYLELLELRITLLDSLCKTLTAARAAIVSFDIDALELQIAQQTAHLEISADQRRSHGASRGDVHDEVRRAVRSP